MSQTEEIDYDDDDDDNSLDLPPYDEEAPSAIQTIIFESFMKKLTKILSKPENDEFLRKAKQILKFLQDRLLKSEKSDEDAFEVTRMIREVWKDPLFVNGVRAAIKEDHYLIDDVLLCSKSSNHDSPADRIARMEEDYFFKYFLMKITPDSPSKTTLSLFLSIIIGHWSDQGVLMELDEQMGENHFGERLKWIAECTALEIARKQEKMERHELSFTMESISDVEALRKALINKYGETHPNIDAMVDSVKRYLVFLLGINRSHLEYDGGKIRINMVGTEGEYRIESMQWPNDQDY